jgi:hypothetical protein
MSVRTGREHASGSTDNEPRYSERYEGASEGCHRHFVLVAGETEEGEGKEREKVAGNDGAGGH